MEHLSIEKFILREYNKIHPAREYNESRSPSRSRQKGCAKKISFSGGAWLSSIRSSILLSNGSSKVCWDVLRYVYQEFIG